MKTNEPLMLLPEYSLDGLDCTLACVKVMNIAILTDADKKKILFSRAVARKKIWLRQCLWITYDWGNQSMVEFSS